MLSVDRSQLHDLIDLDDHRARGRRHRHVEVAARAPIGEVAERIGTMGLEQGEVSGDRGFQQVALAVELPHLFALGNRRPDAGATVEGGDTGATRPDPLGQRPLWHQLQAYLAGTVLPLEVAITRSGCTNGEGGDKARDQPVLAERVQLVAKTDV